MKTLIFVGSPRKRGDTMSLVNRLCKQLQGTIKLVYAYDCNISACLDCRYCRENDGCAIDDDMQRVYDYIRECDNILIASPIYFSMLTGRLLDVASRLQAFYSSRFFRESTPIEKKKKGAIVLVGGGDGHFENAYETALTLLHQMNSSEVFPLVCAHETNIKPAINDEAAVKGIDAIADFFNS